MDNKDNRKVNKNLNKRSKAPEIKIQNMGIDVDKNEYREIVLSNSARPEAAFYNKYR